MHPPSFSVISQLLLIIRPFSAYGSRSSGMTFKPTKEHQTSGGEETKLEVLQIQVLLC